LFNICTPYAICELLDLLYLMCLLYLIFNALWAGPA